MRDARYEDINAPAWKRNGKRFFWWLWDNKGKVAIFIAIVLLLVFLKNSKDAIKAIKEKLRGPTTVVEQPKDLTDSVKVDIVPTVIDTIALKKRWERELATADSMIAVTVTDTVFLAVQELSGPGGTARYKAFELRNAKGEVVGYHNMPM